ncbi:hypothetical protein GDO81_001829 [Engystomops pustulosus]|uniref:T-cell receptor alpha chain constant domain-containing protein n=1 Tax=Engystomops pustulosus TaxID=76066 RepID=A0AAV7DID5_ENGPU|nr:hypothetical protein GDO81_001829 [Engystomops pustulosus]
MTLNTVTASGVDRLIFGTGTRIIVSPKTKREIPSIYPLKTNTEEAGLPNTVCLVTDFPSPDEKLHINDQEIKLDNKAVLDNSSNDVWRYSAVIWDWDNPSKDLSCAGKYGEKSVQPENIMTEEITSTCISLTINERFSTNPSMNTMSISVLGLRILTAKAIIFNLIITMHLWSS